MPPRDKVRVVKDSHDCDRKSTTRLPAALSNSSALRRERERVEYIQTLRKQNRRWRSLRDGSLRDGILWSVTISAAYSIDLSTFVRRHDPPLARESPTRENLGVKCPPGNERVGDQRVLRS